jgi:small subunit ribosomal protein S6
MARVYEVMFIVRPDVLDEDVDKLIAGFEGTVKGGGGSVRTVEKLGRRKLAYTVRKFNDGNYILLTVEAEGALVGELERRLRVTEQVIKFITVRMDEEEKRIEKIKAIRATHKKLSAIPAAPPIQAQPVQAAPVATPVVAASVAAVEAVAAPVVEAPVAEEAPAAAPAAV